MDNPEKGDIWIVNVLCQFKKIFHFYR